MSIESIESWIQRNSQLGREGRYLQRNWIYFPIDMEYRLKNLSLNMYLLDKKNIVVHEDLNCTFPQDIFCRKVLQEKVYTFQDFRIQL
jgi:hypothetical protein